MTTLINEPEQLNVTGTFVTNAAINTQNTTTPLAAPGAGLRYRLYHCGVAFDYSVANPAAGAAMSVKINSNAKTVVIGVALQQPAQSFNSTAGFPMPTNQALRLLHSAGVASINCVYGALYTVEAV